jgi:hypothetical protein
MNDYDRACAVDFFDVELWKKVINLCLAVPENFWQRLFGCDEFHPGFIMTHVFTDQQLRILQGELEKASINPNVKVLVLMSWQNFNTALGTGFFTRNEPRKAYYISFDPNTPLSNNGHGVGNKWLKVSKLKLPECDDGILSVDADNTNDYSTVANKRWDYLRAIFKSLKGKVYGPASVFSGRKWMHYLSNVSNNALQDLIVLCKFSDINCLFRSTLN